MFKVKTLNSISPVGLQQLDQTSYNVSDDIIDPDAILVRSASMLKCEFNRELLCVARAGAGTNNIPVEACGEAGIVVFNTPGANANAVKELVLCAMLLSSRDIIGGIDWVKSIASKGDDIAALVEKGKSAFVGPEIFGKTLGVIGLGAIGAKIAYDAMTMGMKVYGHDPYLSVDAAWRIPSSVINAKDIETIYKNCDYITIHVPYADSTHHLINSCSLGMMKKGRAHHQPCPRGAGERRRYDRRHRFREGGLLRYRLSQCKDRRRPPGHRDPASRRVDAGERGQLRRHGSPGDHRLS